VPAPETDTEIQMIVVIFLDCSIDQIQIPLKHVMDKALPAVFCVALSQIGLELCLGSRIRSVYEHIDKLAFSSGPGRFVADERTDQPRIVLERHTLTLSRFIQTSGKFFAIYIRHTQK
jgi:hypothetical protein